MTAGESLKKHFKEALGLNDDASVWLLMVFDAIQTFDDFADGDRVDRDRLDTLIWQTLVAMPANPFFLANSHNLLPVMATAFLKWKASDQVERSGKANEISFVWRAGYYDVVLMAVQCCHGFETAKRMAHIVLSLYGESYNDYKREFPDA